MPTYADRDSHFHSDSEDFEILYRFARTDIDLDYLDNRRTADSLRAHIRNSSRIDSVIIYVYSSPEGVYEFNAFLARRRASAAESFIMQLASEASSGAQTDAVLTKDKLRVVSVAENWPGLLDLVEERYFRHDREKVIRILKTEDISDATRKWRLQQLDKGYTWNFLLRRYMPQLRSATWVCVWGETIDPLPKMVPMCSGAVIQPGGPVLFRQSDAPYPKPEFSKSNFALKTNFIYDALLSTSIEAEYHFAPHWSVNAECSVAWWSRKPEHKYYQLIQASPELRYWFSSDEMWHGHYLGAFFGAGLYDLEAGAEGYKGEFVMSGFSYGYMFPIGKRFSIEAGLGLGWLQTVYEEYIPMDGHYVYTRTSRTNYVGPVKAKLALVWHIGRSGRKGGGR